MYVNELKVAYSANYNAQTNAHGDTLVDYINTKREIEVGIIPLDRNAFENLMAATTSLQHQISYINPENTLELVDVDCILPKRNIEFYTIQSADNTRLKAFTLKFTEL